VDFYERSNGVGVSGKNVCSRRCVSFDLLKNYHHPPHAGMLVAELYIVAQNGKRKLGEASHITPLS